MDQGRFCRLFVRRLAALTNGRIDDLIRGLAMMACDAGAGAPSSHSPRELPRARRDVPPSWRSARTSRYSFGSNPWAMILAGDDPFRSKDADARHGGRASRNTRARLKWTGVARARRRPRRRLLRVSGPRPPMRPS